MTGWKDEIQRHHKQYERLMDALSVEQAPSEAKEPFVKEQADLGSVPSSEGVRSAAPAEQTPDDGPIWRADATVHIDAPTHDEAQEQMKVWVAEHMPTNFVIGWTLTEAEEDE